MGDRRWWIETPRRSKMDGVSNAVTANADDAADLSLRTTYTVMSSDHGEYEQGETHLKR
jgi:hypothetical protein